MTDAHARRYALKTPPNVGEIIEGEVMVINLDSGVYYSITGAGAAAWPMLVGGATTSEIGEALARRYDVEAATVERDVDAFIERLAGEGILRPLADAAAIAAVAAVPEALAAVAYPGFGFERFEDMQALLVIDPVHEVGDFGWPLRAAASDKAR
ncbi:MAG TPA: PqqD family protein [Casimicrobiaceae bacterium]|nr:PqqD family protein [Casimicrobiaceae bacterium]